MPPFWQYFSKADEITAKALPPLSQYFASVLKKSVNLEHVIRIGGTSPSEVG
jgi:hypothetical protein